jgi:hypothetical protein
MVECVQIAGNLGAMSLSHETWLLLRLSPHYPDCSMVKEQVLVSLLFLANQKCRSSRTPTRSSFYNSRGCHSG